MEQRRPRGLEQWVPAIGQARTYERRWLGHDIGAGLVLTALLVPAGMGYAQASGLPPITGLYATVIPLLVYAVFGPSRVLVMGPDSSLAPLIFAAVVPLSAGDPGRAIALAGTVSVLAGLVCLLAGLARFGFLAELLSAPVRYGYLNGIALTVAASQLPSLFGFSVEGDTLFDHVRGFARGLADGRTEPWALAIGAGVMVVVVVGRHVAPRVPGTLVAVVGAIVAVRLGGLADEGVPLVGRLPRGLPTPTMPDLSFDDLARLLGAALGIAFISFTDTSILSRAYALRRGAKVDADQELVALGLVNVASGFFQGFAVSGSQSRTPVAESAGARTQLTGVVAAAAIVGLLVAAPGLLRDLPVAALAGVVIAAVARLVTIRAVARLAAIRRSEFVLSLAAFVAVAVLGVIVGVAVAIALSLLNFMRRAWLPHTAELVRVDGLRGFHDLARHPEGHRIPGLVLYRFDAPLFFANARFFADDVLATVDRAPQTVRTLVITAEPMTDIDTTAADVLQELIHALDTRGVDLQFAELKGQVRERLGVYGMLDLVGRDHFFRTTTEAVEHHLNAPPSPP